MGASSASNFKEADKSLSIFEHIATIFKCRAFVYISFLKNCTSYEKDFISFSTLFFYIEFLLPAF